MMEEPAGQGLRHRARADLQRGEGGEVDEPVLGRKIDGDKRGMCSVRVIEE
jgi:hypothetical protein